MFQLVTQVNSEFVVKQINKGMDIQKLSVRFLEVGVYVLYINIPVTINGVGTQ